MRIKTPLCCQTGLIRRIPALVHASRIHLIAFAALMWTSSPSSAANLLSNPSFEENTGNVVAAGWTYFRPANGGDGSYWCDTAGARAHSGNVYWKQWGIYWDANRTNVAGIYQQFNSAPTSRYEASGWFYTLETDAMGPNNKAWLEVSFRDTGGKVLALYKSDDFNADWGKSTWFNLSVTNVCDLSQPISSGDTNSGYFYYAVTGSVNQIVAPPGTAFVRYQFAMVQGGGWPEGGGAVQFDDAVLNQISGPLPPTLSSLWPANRTMFVDPADGLSFVATSPSGTTIPNSGIKVLLNGLDVSSSLSISGTDSSKTVTYGSLASNSVYTASISVTDAYNFSINANVYFETTWVGIPAPIMIWEAEDYDFNGGEYINNPTPCTASGNANCYFGKVSIEGVDYFDISGAPAGDGDHLFRADRMATTGSGDLLRESFVTAGALDYKVGWFSGTEWVNYTRDWPAGSYWIIARLANGGGSGTLTLSQVSASATNDLGTFTIANGTGWTSYDNYYLKDANGNLAIVNLNGKATLRATTGGNVDMGFFVLVPARADIPMISDLYPNGVRPLQHTNKLSFNVSSTGGSISPANIKLILNGSDVSSALQIGGTASARSVVYPSLLPNAIHTAVLTVTNDGGVGIRITNRFDTFSEANYMVEAEDFDYDNGKFNDDNLPNGYQGINSAVEGVDFHHVTTGGEQFSYRLGLPSERSGDFVREKFATGTDFNIGWFPGGDWANYTRTYPAGNYFVYGRLAGDGGYSLYLDKVTSGAGTPNQTTQRLGRWGFVGRGWQTYDWVPLTDEGLAAPVVVTLNGLTTLRITTAGGTNPNYFMLVPASGISIRASLAGGVVSISFPTQAGVSYRVFYRDELNSGNWSLLSTVPGDGSEKAVQDSPTGAKRYYRVTAQ